MNTVALVFALAAASSSITAIDANGDGKPEPVVVGEAGITIGGIKLPLGEMQPEMCEVEAADLVGTDKTKDVVVCEIGPRDERMCTLFVFEGGAFRPLGMPDGARPPKIVTAGNSIVVAEVWRDRLYTRREKLQYAAGKLTLVKQPHYVAAMEKVHVDTSFPVLVTPGGKDVVATVKPNSDIEVVLEHGEKEHWYLVKLTSGIAGWVSFEALVAASTAMQMRMGAG
ncbi:MAG: hypothetical protein Q8O67_00430 [Deltaproteobacteria bacterium]|nr:hypothetical protein [Deltaproteobacteria bacterium]